MEELKSNGRKIDGTIFPARWDEKGQIAGLVIDTDDQDEYFIALNRKGKELLPYIHHEVELTGTLKEDDDGHYVINVKSFRIKKDDVQEKN